MNPTVVVLIIVAVVVIAIVVGLYFAGSKLQKSKLKLKSR